MTKIKNWISNLFGISPSKPPKPQAPANIVELSADPDSPEDFGFKINWFAVKTSDVEAVQKALGWGAGRPANWRSGLEAAYSSRIGGYDKDLAFITPPVAGWVMIVGAALPYPVMHTTDRHGGIGASFDTLLAGLGACFSDVQFFGNHRVAGFNAWAHMQAGAIGRIFAFGDGDVYANIGKQTAEEAALGLPELNGLSLADATAKMFEDSARLPDEEDVLQLAERWSINPGKLTEMTVAPAFGLVVELPRIR